jgi:hypothetical protein
MSVSAFGKAEYEANPRPRHVAINKRTPTMQMVSQISSFNSNNLKVAEDQVRGNILVLFL